MHLESRLHIFAHGSARGHINHTPKARTTAFVAYMTGLLFLLESKPPSWKTPNPRRTKACSDNVMILWVFFFPLSTSSFVCVNRQTSATLACTSRSMRAESSERPFNVFKTQRGLTMSQTKTRRYRSRIKLLGSQHIESVRETSKNLAV